MVKEQALNLSGKFDLCYYTETTALVIDYKTGFSEPTPGEESAQLKVLAVLVALHLPTVREVIVQIISPYGPTEHRYSISELRAAYTEIVETLRSLQALEAPLAASQEACRYCPAKNICPAIKALVAPVVRLRGDALPDGERAAKLLDEVDLLQVHLDQIREHYFSRLAADPAYQIPGWALVPGRTRREVLDWLAATDRLRAYIGEGALLEAADYNLTKLEKALGRKLGLRGAALKERTAEILEGLIQEKQNRPSLRRVNGQPKLRELA